MIGKRLTRMPTFYMYTINFIIDNYQKKRRKKRNERKETVVTTYLVIVQYEKCIFYLILSVKCNFSSLRIFQCSAVCVALISSSIPKKMIVDFKMRVYHQSYCRVSFTLFFQIPLIPIKK